MLLLNGVVAVVDYEHESALMRLFDNFSVISSFSDGTLLNSFLCQFNFNLFETLTKNYKIIIWHKQNNFLFYDFCLNDYKNNLVVFRKMVFLDHLSLFLKSWKPTFSSNFLLNSRRSKLLQNPFFYNYFYLNTNSNLIPIIPIAQDFFNQLTTRGNWVDASHPLYLRQV